MFEIGYEVNSKGANSQDKKKHLSEYKKAPFGIKVLCLTVDELTVCNIKRHLSSIRVLK